ncbi:MAG: hypothetical protein ABIG61_00415 [Planctomycetota bacterium]
MAVNSENVIRQSLANGEIANYVPLLLGNGDIGGTFDPLGGTFLDEYRISKTKPDDIRTLKLSRLIANDYWELVKFSPDEWPLCQRTVEMIEQELRQGKPVRERALRWSPFTISIMPADAKMTDAAAMLKTLSSHEISLDVFKPVLKAAYSYRGKRIQANLFIHPQESLLVYRFVSEATIKMEIAGNQTRPANYDSLGVVNSQSSIFCPTSMGMYVQNGNLEGNTIIINPGESTVYLGYGHQILGNTETEAIRVVKWAVKKGYNELLKGHNNWWHDRMNRSWIHIPDKRLQRTWERGKYYILTSVPRRICDGVSFESGLAGSFPAFMALGLQDAMYQLLCLYATGNSDLMEASLEWLLEMLPIAEQNARSEFFLRGARYPWQTSPGMLIAVRGHSHYEPCAWEHHVNGWIALALMQYLKHYSWRRDMVKHFLPMTEGLAEFFESMVIRNGSGLSSNGKLFFDYKPVHSQAEIMELVNRKNLIDVLFAAHRCFKLARIMHEKINSTESEKWLNLENKIPYEKVIDKNRGFLFCEDDDIEICKDCTQFMGLHFQLGLETNKDMFLKSWKRLRKTTIFGCCSWDPGYVAFGLSCLDRPKEALEHLQTIFDKKNDFVMGEDIAFRECNPGWLGTRKGRMPYYLAANSMFNLGLESQLLRDVGDSYEVFPSCAFEDAEFQLYSQGQPITWKKHGSEVNR